MIGENLLGPEPTLLPADDEVTAALAAGAEPAAVVRAHPESSLAWALLADGAYADGREIESYAFARVGYHRGLDRLRANGWRGSGYVRWSHAENRGFLRCLEGLRAAAAAIGEADEEERCALFLRQLDPSWPPATLD